MEAEKLNAISEIVRANTSDAEILASLDVLETQNTDYNENYQTNINTIESLNTRINELRTTNAGLLQRIEASSALGSQQTFNTDFFKR